jgi:hypothetical protein
MPDTERVGDGVVKTTYLKSDGLHAFYIGSNSYAGTTGERLLETVTSERLNWDTDKEGNKTLRACYDGIWLRASEDTGITWTDAEGRVRFDTEVGDEQLMPAGISLDERTGRLVRFYRGQKADSTCYGYINQGTYRVFFSVSVDGGGTWTDPVQVIDGSGDHDEDRWGPEIEYGVRGALPCGDHSTWLADGSLLLPLTGYERLDGTKPWYFRVICARGRWNEDGSGLDWELGSYFEVGSDKATSGCCEPSITSLGGDKLFMTTRCQGGGPQGLYSTRFSTVSGDGGMTWSAPEPLLYDDGSPVWTPASVSAFYDSSRTGKTYWIGNILDGPVHGQVPRYPLRFAEFDPEGRCLVKASVRLIQDRPEGAHEHVRYTNFGWYEDRRSGNLIITLPEQYRDRGYDQMEKPEDFAADCVKYTITL